MQLHRSSKCRTFLCNPREGPRGLCSRPIQLHHKAGPSVQCRQRDQSRWFWDPLASCFWSRECFRAVYSVRFIIANKNKFHSDLKRSQILIPLSNSHLQISMSNSFLVAIVHTSQDIQHENSGILFWESAVGFNLVKKLSSLKDLLVGNESRGRIILRLESLLDQPKTKIQA